MRTIKVVLIGDVAVGKTWLCSTYISNETPKGYVTNVFNNFGKRVKFENIEYLLSIWDTSGIKECNRVSSLSYQQADVFIVCYSLTNRESFKLTNEILEFLKSYEVPIILCATKSDKKEERVVREATGRKQVEKFKCYEYIETSALNFTNVNKLFELTVEAAVKPKIIKNNRCCGIFNCC